MQRLLENWRRYNKNIEEIRLMQESEKHRIIREYDVPSKEAYGASFEDFKSQLEEFSDATWIFFDTETTGLNADKDFNQITQIAAIAVDVKGFKEDPVILEKFNVKVRLTGRTKSFMGWERGKQKERAKSGQASNFKTIPDIFKMTGYGVARDPEKAKRKAYLSAPEGTSMNDVPEQVEFKHGKEALESFQAFLEKYEYRILVAQNAPFDARFIKKMYQRIGMRTTQDTIIDTVQIFKQFLSPF